MPFPKATKQPRLSGSFQSKIDVEKLAKATEADFQDALFQIEAKVEEVYNQVAKNSLTSTAQAYLDGVKIVRTDTGVEASIEGWLPVALDEGYPGGDMKRNLLQGRQSRVIPMHDGDFRTVSVNSPPDSWWHPGIQANNISEQVREEVEPIAEALFGEILGRVKV